MLDGANQSKRRHLRHRPTLHTMGVASRLKFRIGSVVAEYGRGQRSWPFGGEAFGVNVVEQSVGRHSGGACRGFGAVRLRLFQKVVDVRGETASVSSPASKRSSPKVANISNPGMNATSNQDTWRSKHAEHLGGITNCHRSALTLVGCVSRLTRWQRAQDGLQGRQVRQRNSRRAGPTGAADESHARTSLSACLLRAGLHQSAGTHRGHHPLGAEHRQGREPHDPRCSRSTARLRTTRAPTATNSRPWSGPPASIATRPIR